MVDLAPREWYLASKMAWASSMYTLSCGHTISQAVSAQPVLVLSPGLMSESLSSNTLPAHTSRPVFQVATMTIYAVFLLLWRLHSPLRLWGSPSVQADLAGEGASQGAGTLPLPQLPSRVRNPSSSTAPSQGCRSHPDSFLIFLLIFFPIRLPGEFLALSAVWGALPVFSRYSVRTLPHVNVFLHLWEKGSFMSYYSTIITAPQVWAF